LVAVFDEQAAVMPAAADSTMKPRRLIMKPSVAPRG
jgi:hypothetical protein